MKKFFALIFIAVTLCSIGCSKGTKSNSDFITIANIISEFPRDFEEYEKLKDSNPIIIESKSAEKYTKTNCKDAGKTLCAFFANIILGNESYKDYLTLESIPEEDREDVAKLVAAFAEGFRELNVATWIYPQDIRQCPAPADNYYFIPIVVYENDDGENISIAGDMLLRKDKNIWKFDPLAMVVDDYANKQTTISTSGSQYSESDLNILSYTEESETIVERYYRKDFPNIKVGHYHTRSDVLPQTFDTALANGSDMPLPDVVFMEEVYIRDYVEKGDDILLDLTDIYEEAKSKLVPYTVQIGTHNKKVYALSYHAAPGVMYYRRSLAKKYFGTDDPAKIQKLFNNWDNFLKNARVLNENSNGKCAVISSTYDLWEPFKASRKSPWVVNGRLNIDQSMLDYIKLCKTLKEEKLDLGVDQWSNEWFAAMDGKFVDYYGNKKEAFACFLPTWGLHYILKPDCPITAGDWAMIPGPAPYYWGGTWVVATKNSKNPELAKEFIKYICTNDKFLTQWGLDTNDLVVSYDAINKIKDNPQFVEKFIGGQNFYKEFEKVLPTINAVRQSTDRNIEKFFQLTVDDYLHGDLTFEEAVRDFKISVEQFLLD